MDSSRVSLPSSQAGSDPIGGAPLEQPGPLTIIIEWYKALPKRAREGMSLANLHDLSKQIGSRSYASEQVTCPHATESPLRYCSPCKADPCPMEPEAIAKAVKP